MRVKICPSLMCADLSRLGQEIQDLELAGSDIFHLDIMDGKFVPNFALGLEDVKAVAKLAKIPFDIHLMIEEPDDYIELFARYGPSIIYVHPESTFHIHRVLVRIRDLGCKAGIVLNPGTPIGVLEEVTELLDYVLVMAVNPGFAGQKFIKSTVEKTRRLKKYLVSEGSTAEIAVDGGINPGTLGYLHKAGATCFIAGTSGLFGKGKPYSDLVKELKDVGR